ncbi:MAG TPA: LysM peptidoglycan-binding domain-containing protein [Clostridiales bacterium]|nr:LysM peptidoglycan-binding domain-containing protein [Clostridiales bacterium]
MKLQPMSYKSYVWPVNPETVRMEAARNLKEVALPFSGSVVQDLGAGRRMVSGAGRFTGSTCLDDYAQLESVFAAGGSGVLRLPGGQVLSAVFSCLKMTGKAGPDCITYEFTFLEDAAGAEKAATQCGGVYICTGGENLWALANRYGTTVDRLRAINPMIQWPNHLKAGLKVVLP